LKHYLQLLNFSAALVSLMAIAGKGISAATSAREQTVGHYLAQEGLEVARNMRDTTGGWEGVLKSCRSTSPCNVNYIGGPIPVLESCGGACVPVLTNNGAFVDAGNGAVPSIYTRSVFINPEILTLMILQNLMNMKSPQRLLGIIAVLLEPSPCRQL
jgi:hypothetical protein